MGKLFEYIVISILRILLNAFNIFRIKNNRIMFYSFNGKQYSCNPRWISEFLNDKYPKKFEIIWAVKDPKKFENIIPKNIFVVRFRSIKYYYLAKTSHIIVQNVQGYGELSRREGQIVIQTWHASNGYKKKKEVQGIERKLELLYHKDYSYVMSGSESMSERRVRKSMGFIGPIIPGTPRMDIIINNEYLKYKRKVYKCLNIPDNKKLLLYAPTWRKDRNNIDYGINYLQLKNVIENKFSGEWIIVIRLHPNVYKKQLLNEEYLRDATNYPDMEELLCATDCLVSDYSSCIWDFSFTYRPCFLFCSDIEKYISDRDFDIPIKKWHFPIATSMDEMIDIVELFDEKKYIENVTLHHFEMKNLEDGNATNRVCTLINEIVYGRKNEKV